MGAWLEWRGVLRLNEHEPHRGFWCPACRRLHVYDERWTFNGNYEAPTFTPSLKVSSGHHVAGMQMQADGKCGICERARERGVRSICGICHLHVTNGKILYSSDCTHELAGQTVAMTIKPPDDDAD